MNKAKSDPIKALKMFLLNELEVAIFFRVALLRLSRFLTLKIRPCKVHLLIVVAFLAHFLFFSCELD